MIKNNKEKCFLSDFVNEFLRKKKYTNEAEDDSIWANNWKNKKEWIK